MFHEPLLSNMHANANYLFLLDFNYFQRQNNDVSRINSTVGRYENALNYLEMIKKIGSSYTAECLYILIT